MKHKQASRGGIFIGIIIGILIGLVAALVVALYVAKVPTPFSNRAQTRTAEQDQREAERNKNWDPNAPLASKVPIPKSVASALADTRTDTIGPPLKPASSIDPTLASGAKQASAAGPTASKPPAVAGDPIGDIAKAVGARPTESKPAAEPRVASADPFVYFVQVGAYRTQEDADAQRAKLQMAGFDAKITEREQAGRVVYRVRTGPFERREDADRAKSRLSEAGFENQLVSVQR